MSCNSTNSENNSLPKVLTENTHANRNQIITLFKEYKYGQPISDFSGLKDYTDCSEEFGFKVLCKEDVRFLENTFSSGLFFNNDKLEKIGLYADYSEELLTKILVSIPQNDYLVTYISDEKNGAVDLISLSNKSGREIVENKINETVLNMINDKDNLCKISFLEIVNMKPEELKKSTTSSELILKAPNKNRLCDITILHGDDNSSAIEILFYPIEMFKKKESF